jgi:hypothetical protein
VDSVRDVIVTGWYVSEPVVLRTTDAPDAECEPIRFSHGSPVGRTTMGDV